ncbi:hypothetical protein IT568_02225 [bacterium]|nr:hypothetical protein [bacterium]
MKIYKVKKVLNSIILVSWLLIGFFCSSIAFEEKSLFTGVLATLCFLVVGYLFLFIKNSKIEIHKEKIVSVNFYGKTKEIHFDKISQIATRHFKNYLGFYLFTQETEKIEFSTELDGWENLLLELLEKIPALSFDASVTEMIEKIGKKESLDPRVISLIKDELKKRQKKI